MKLAEGLLLRSDIQKKLASLQVRAQRYVIVQEGEAPAEDPQSIFREIDALANQFERLIYSINRANLQYKLKSGQSLTEALAHRDTLTLRHRILLSVIEVCTKPAERYGMKEIRWVTTVSVPSLQQQVDALAKEIRELNAAIQEAGWQVELEE
jgi:hypothetical protein